MEPTANPHRDREIEIAFEFLARHLSPSVCDHFRRILSASDPEQAVEDIGAALRRDARLTEAAAGTDDGEASDFARAARLRALAGETP